MENVIRSGARLPRDPRSSTKENLKKLVARMKKTGATLIWATTTKVPEGEAGRKVGDDVIYNKIAAKIMAAEGVRVNDLHKLSASFPDDHFVKPGDVHYTKAASLKLAEQVVASINEAIAKK